MASNFPKFHRDINWLSFNQRVLQEAENKENPLYERLKFLAIFSSNLDEFFRVRVSQQRHLKSVDKSVKQKLSLKPNKILKEILSKVEAQQKRFGRAFAELKQALAEENCFLLASYELGSYRDRLENHYQKAILPLLEPQLVDLNKEDELFLADGQLYLVASFENTKDKIGIINIPSDKVDRFYHWKEQDRMFVCFIDDIIRSYAGARFPDQRISGLYAIKLSRDAELYMDDEYDGELADKIYDSLGQRETGQPTRLLYDQEMPVDLLGSIREHLHLGKIDMMAGGNYHNFDDFFQFPGPDDHERFVFKDLPEIKPYWLKGDTDIFELIKTKDRLVHFPYMDFGLIEQFLEAAVDDDQVKRIRISLYRIADESKLTQLLLQAARNGKKVTIFVEAKARFDEANNISWGKKFEACGAKVIYSYPKIKVHSKICCITRDEPDGKKYYGYIGTGNFNSKSSKIYCDHGLLTADQRLTKELLRVFQVLEGKLIIPRNKHLMVSPFTTRRRFEKLIDHEIANARQGKTASITAKMNSLEDDEMIDLLYKAGKEGVNIRLIVRGFTRLIQEKERLSENIRITSIVDRFLEHGRIYHFHHSGEEKLYIGSADWMKRNLDRRIEVLTPIYDQDLQAELKHILHLQLNDNVKARIQDEEETNRFVERQKDQPIIRSQYAIYDYLKEKHAKHQDRRRSGTF
ncbi:MAG: polyphosphate kinase 1 [Psychroflexus sp.]|nr:polyphosphate kinase 1 [Psychroflexus sp.]